MDAPFEIPARMRITKITLEVDFVDESSPGQKFFDDAYNYQNNRAKIQNQPSLDEAFARKARSNEAFPRQAISDETLSRQTMSDETLTRQAMSSETLNRQAMCQLADRLLLEIMYLAILTRYYEDLYYQQSRFVPSPYSGQPNQFSFAPSPYSDQPDQFYSDNPIPQPYGSNFAHNSFRQNYHIGHYQNHQSPRNIEHYPNTKHYPNLELGPKEALATQPYDRSSDHSSDYSLGQTHAPKAHSSLAHDVVSIARHNLGRPLWAFTKFASFCQSGYLGCAATVSELLQIAGLELKGSANVAGVIDELSHLGWHKVKIYDKHQFKAGDVVYGLKGSHAHIGIITAADNNKVLVCDNSSSSGTLKERTIESGGSFTPNGRFAGNLYVMRQG